jgi:hypothetical protein
MNNSVEILACGCGFAGFGRERGGKDGGEC